MSMVRSALVSPLFSLPLPQYAGKLCDVAWSASGTYLAAVTSAGWVFLWESHTGAVLQQKQVTRTPLLSIAWARQGTCLAVGGQDGIVRLLDEQFLVCSTYRFDAPIKRIAWAPHVVGACMIVTGQQVTVLREDTRTTRVLRYQSEVLDVAWSGDGRQIALLCADGLVEIWHARQARLLHRFSTAPMVDGSLLWDQACRTLMVVDDDGPRYSYALFDAGPISFGPPPVLPVLLPKHGGAGRPVHDPSGRYLATINPHAVHLSAIRG